MNLNNLSVYRSHLMGVAMLLVLFHHLPMPITDGVIGYLHSNGGIGVDVFLIFSGMGLYYSSSKRINLKENIYQNISDLYCCGSTHVNRKLPWYRKSVFLNVYYWILGEWFMLRLVYSFYCFDVYSISSFL